MTPIRNHHTNLPISSNLALIYILSTVIAILMAGLSAYGILYRTNANPSEELLKSFASNDVVNLCVGLPILLGSMWLTRRSKLISLLCWSGALLFVLYNYIAYVFASPLHWAFLGYITPVALSLYTLIALAASIDGKTVKSQLTGTVPEKFAVAILTGFGVLFLLRVIGVIAGALTGGTAIAQTDLAINISDFLISPALIIGGISLWRQKALGYLSGLGLLFQASMLCVGLILFMLLQPILAEELLVITDVLVVFGMGLICFVPFALFLRDAASKQGTKAA